MSDRDYCCPPDYAVLRNRLDIRDAAALEAAERELVAFRLLEPMPPGDFDFDHLKAIHRHLFQDVYEWADEVRTVEIAHGREPVPAAAVHRRRHGGRSPPHRGGGVFPRVGAGRVRRGSGPGLGRRQPCPPVSRGQRAQLQYLKQLAARAGHAIDLTRIDLEAWMDASRRSNAGDHAAIARCLRQALV